MIPFKSIGRLFSGIKGAYNDINSSTLTGAIDVIVLKQLNGSFSCGPFHVRFGKLTAIHPADKHVEVYVNGTLLNFIHMRLGSAGDAYFVESNDVIIDSDNESNCDAKSLPDTFFSNSCQLDENKLNTRRRKRRVRRDLFNSESEVSNIFVKDDICISENKEYSYTNSDESTSVFECLSDGEYSVEILPSNTTLHYSSDSALAVVNEKFDKSLQWDWGNFPKRAAVIEDQILCNDHINEPDSFNKFETILDHTNISSTTDQISKDGVYLEDLVTSKVCDEIKQNYIYPPPDNYKHNSRDKKKTINELNSIDAGYKSDGECSSCSAPNCHFMSDMKLSLCGNLSADSPISSDKFYECLVSFEEFLQDPDSILSNPNLVILLNGKYLNWSVVAPIIVSIFAFQTELPHLTLNKLENLHMPKKKVQRKTWFSWGMRLADPEESSVVPSTTSCNNDLKDDHMSSTCLNSPESLHLIISSKETEVNQISSVEVIGKPTKRNRLTSDEICQLDLKPGRNEIEFRVTTKYQGTCSCSASIFLWDFSDRIVISDVDGTITRSDVLGHLLPMIGRDWTRDGVAQLYHQIYNNGYKFLYLSSRPLGQAGLTRSYLRQIEQEGCFRLPEGPILLSPNSLLRAIHQEVIEKTPEVFKIQCLKDVRALFPSDTRPLYAGFGNKINDVLAYIASGVPKCRIFIINPTGLVQNQYNKVGNTSYCDMSNLVDHFFPYMNHDYYKLCREPAPSSEPKYLIFGDKSKCELFNSNVTSYPEPSSFTLYTYWRDFSIFDTKVDVESLIQDAKK